MFDPVREDGTGAQFVGAILAILRNRWFRRGVLVVLSLVIACFGVWSWFWHATLDVECRAANVPRLNVDDFLALRARKNAYQRSTDLSPWLVITPEEFTYLLAEHRGMAVEIAAEGQIMDVHLGLPVTGGCYNLHVRGDAKIEDGTLVVRPEYLKVGSYDMSWLAGGWTYEIHPEDLADADLATVLSNTRALRVESGVLHLRLKDRTAKWSFREQ